MGFIQTLLELVDFSIWNSVLIDFHDFQQYFGCVDAVFFERWIPDICRKTWIFIFSFIFINQSPLIILRKDYSSTTPVYITNSECAVIKLFYHQNDKISPGREWFCLVLLPGSHLSNWLGSQSSSIFPIIEFHLNGKCQLRHPRSRVQCVSLKWWLLSCCKNTKGTVVIMWVEIWHSCRRLLVSHFSFFKAVFKRKKTKRKLLKQPNKSEFPLNIYTFMRSSLIFFIFLIYSQ